MKKKIFLIFVLAFVMTIACSCGGGSNETAETKAAETEAADNGQNVEFLLGTWTSATVTANGQTVDALEAMDGKLLVLIFNEDGTCTMSTGGQNAYVDWTLNDDGSVTLKGDGTYNVTFADEGKTQMNFEYNDMIFGMEKSEE